jgi:WD40 repeat protein
VLSDSEVDFLIASSIHEQNEEQRRAAELEYQKKRNRQLRWSLVGVAGLLVLAVLAGSLAAVRGRQAQNSAAAAQAAATQADAARLAVASRSEDNIGLALLMARQSAALSNSPVRQADVLAAIVRADVVSSVTASAQPNFRLGDSSSPDGRRALSTDWKDFGNSGDDMVTLVDTSTGLSVGPAIHGDGAGFFDHGTKVAVMRDTHGAPGHDRVIVRVDANDARQLGPAEPVPGSVSGAGGNASHFFDSDMLHIAPNGKALLSFLDRRARLWRWDGRAWRGPAVMALPPFPSPSIPGQDELQDATFSDDARYATMTVTYQGGRWYTGLSMSIALDLRAMRPVSPWSTGGNHASIAPDGRHWAVPRGSGVGFEIRSTDPAVTTVVRVPATAASRAWSFGWSSDSRRLAVGHFDGSLTVYQVDPLVVLRQFPAEGTESDIIALADRGRTAVSIHGDGRITVHSVIGADAVLQVTATTEVGAVAAGPPGTVVAGGLEDGRIAVVDQHTGAIKRTLWLGPYRPPDRTSEPALHLLVTALAVTPDGTAIVAGNRSGHLRMWRVSDGAQLWAAQVGPVEELAVSPDGRFLATFEAVDDPTDPFSRAPDSWFPMRTTFRLWDLHTRRVLLTAAAPHPAGSAVKVRSLVFSPDSSMVAVPYMFGKVLVYQTRSHAKPVEITPDELGSTGPGADAVTFRPDSSTLLVQASDRSVIVPFDPHTGRRNGSSYPGPAGGGNGMIGFSPDGRWLFSRAGDGLSAFDVTSRRLLLDHLDVGSTYGAGYGEGSMAIVPDGHLYTATETGITRLDIDPTRWDAAACALAGRSLTRDEWSQLLPGRPYAPACTLQGASTTPQH